MTKTPERLVRPWPSLPPLRLDLFVAYVGMGDNWHFTQAEKDRLWERAGHMTFDGLWAEIEAISHDGRRSYFEEAHPHG
jgi:hypothetical protein